MSTLTTAPRLVRPRPATSTIPAEIAVTPQVFEPQHSQTPRERASLFNLKAKPGYYNAAAKAALLRREKQPPHDELFVDFSGSEVRLEMLAGGVPLIDGDWTMQAIAGGQTLKPAGPWSEVCWHREDLCDYLEIDLPLTGGWRLERHLVLARQDRFLFLADALLGPNASPADLEYRHSLPLANSISVQAARETRELALLRGGRRCANVVPLALGEWRAEYCQAGCTAENGALHLQQTAQGRSLFSPIWIDLDPRRLMRPLTWRRLSVGENLGIVPRDIAAGYRVQAGNEQWLIYRSLTPIGNRSILGHNTAYSFICGRIKKDGNFDPIIEIE